MPKPIKTENQYETALERIYELMQKDIKPNSKESDELEILSILVKDYENEVYPMDKPNLIKENLGLLLLMQKANRNKLAGREEVMNFLETNSQIPNNQTINAIQELKKGNGVKFGSVDDLFKSV